MWDIVYTVKLREEPPYLFPIQIASPLQRCVEEKLTTRHCAIDKLLSMKTADVIKGKEANKVIKSSVQN